MVSQEATVRNRVEAAAECWELSGLATPSRHAAYANRIPGAGPVQIVAGCAMTELDHIVVAAHTMAQGLAYVEALLGVAMAPGGAHPRMATHNHLLRLGDAVFLEVIAIDPAGQKPARPRWFDLDNIALMALRKDPARRYASVAQFSEDIRRHLDGLPVIARKDTFGYRASKFIARHKAGVAAAALVFLAIVAGMTVSVWEARIAARERDEARQEKAKADHLNLFLQTILSAASPEAKGRDAKVIEVLNDAAGRIDSEW
jgi:hypothetical protein